MRSSLPVAFALLLASLSAPAFALDAGSPLEKAISHYEEGAFAVARDALSEVIRSPASTMDERSRARTYLAATLLDLSDRQAARRTLVELFAEDPQATIDPLVFPAELLVVAEQSRAEAKTARAARVATPDAGSVAARTTTPPGLTEVAAPAGGGSGSLRGYALVPAVVGGAALIGSGIAYAQARSVHSELTVSGQFRDQAHVDEVAGNGKRAQTISGVLLGLGVAALGVAGGMYLFGGDGGAPPLALDLDLQPGGAGVALSGAF